MVDAVRIIDADTHQMEPPEFWEERIDPVFRDRAPRMLRREAGRTYVVEGETLTRSDGKSYPMTLEYGAASAAAAARFAKARDAGYSPASRLEDMDAHGVEVQVLYPTVTGQLLGREFHDLDLLVACCRAYNDWCADYCATAPARLRWAAAVPLQDVPSALEEVRRTYAMGAGAFFVRPQPIKDRNLSHRDYFPLWKEIERLDRPLCIHDSASCQLPSFGDRMLTHTTGHIISHPFEAMAAMTDLIWNGVFEHFPVLTVVHVEADSGWVPYWLQRMEQHWQHLGNAEHPNMNRSPTDYFKSNVFVACRGDEPTLKSVVELVGDDELLINTDYPHADGTWPWGFDELRRQPIPESSIEKILWSNGARAFRIDHDGDV
jgi:predicted TIM-barrel fold metal-dependent hydrolase